jgi:hypothetical protein
MEAALELSPGHVLHYASFDGVTPSRAARLLQRYLPPKISPPEPEDQQGVGSKRKAESDSATEGDASLPQVAGTSERHLVIVGGRPPMYNH